MSTSQNQKASPYSNSITLKKLKQAAPEPKSGRRPEMKMLISFGDKKNIPARVLLNSGCTTPIASEKWTEDHNVPFATSKEQNEIQNFAGDTVEDCG